MDISTLTAFVTVAEQQSFSLASEQLFLTQPAISKRIATLESELDTRLFDRIGRQISLTESGEALLPRARRILLELEDSRRAISNLSGKVAGTLSIATSHHIGLHRLPPVLRQFNTEYADVDLDLRFMDSEEACRSVLHGQIELALVTLPPVIPEELQADEIWPDPLHFVIHKDHPLKDKKSVRVETLCNFPAVLPTKGTYTRELIETSFAPYDVNIPIRIGTNYLETLKMMVSVGMGWSVLPETMINRELKMLKVRNIQLQRRLGIVNHRHRTLSNAALAIQKILFR